MIRYSFIIPVKEINDYIRETVPEILKIKRDDFEIIIYPDAVNEERWDKTRQIASGPGGPAMKRTLALEHAQGEIIIFVDDDAYPQQDFLDVLDRSFADPGIVGVGGPAVTPKSDNLWQKTSGAFFLSTLSGGNPERYVPIGKKRDIDDWPSVNLSVRAADFRAVGGFQSSFWPGEDTILCSDLIRKTGKRLLYDPELIAYHHRREGLRRHLVQVGRYGLHRGFFAKKFPDGSLGKAKYFIPALFVLFVLLGGIASFFHPVLPKLYALGWALYALALAKAIWDILRYEKSKAVAFHSIYYIFLSHMAYGIRFLQGLFLKELKSKFR